MLFIHYGLNKNIIKYMQKDIQLEVLISFKDQEELNQVPVKGTV